VVVGDGRLECLVVEGLVLEREEAWYFEQIQLVVGGLGDGMSRQVCIHICECLLLDLSFSGFWRLDAVCPPLIVPRIQVCIVKLALVVPKTA
jgi:hypothetical protein